MGTLIKTDGISIAEREGLVLSYFAESKSEFRGTDLMRLINVPRGSVYVILKRMEQKKLLQSRVSDDATYNLGPAPRYWSLTLLGQKIAEKIRTL